MRLRHKLGQATAQALGWLDAHGCEVFARSPQSLCLWVAFPGVQDSLRLAEQLVPRKLSMPPGRVFHVDPSAVSRWSRCNVSAMLDPRFQAAMGQVLAHPA